MCLSSEIKAFFSFCVGNLSCVALVFAVLRLGWVWAPVLDITEYNGTVKTLTKLNVLGNNTILVAQNYSIPFVLSTNMLQQDYWYTICIYEDVRTKSSMHSSRLFFQGFCPVMKVDQIKTSVVSLSVYIEWS